MVFPCKPEIRVCTEIGLRLKQVDVVSPAGCVWKPPAAHFHQHPKPAQEPVREVYSRHKKSEGATLLGGECSLPSPKAACCCQGQGEKPLLEQRLRGSGLGDLGGLFARGQEKKKIQRGSRAESRWSPVATEMGPSRTTRYRSFWCALG